MDFGNRLPTLTMEKKGHLYASRTCWSDIYKNVKIGSVGPS